MFDLATMNPSRIHSRGVSRIQIKDGVSVMLRSIHSDIVCTPSHVRILMHTHRVSPALHVRKSTVTLSTDVRSISD